MFEVTMRQQGLTHLMDSLYNPLEQLTFGGRLSGGDLVYKGKRNGVYQSTPYVAWCYTSGVARRNHHFQVTLNTAQSSFEEWEEGLVQTEKSVELVKTGSRRVNGGMSFGTGVISIWMMPGNLPILMDWMPMI